MDVLCENPPYTKDESNVTVYMRETTPYTKDESNVLHTV